MATATQTRRVSKSGGAAEGSQLFLTIRGTFYGVGPIRGGDAAIASKAFRLLKADGTRYDVACTPHGLTCDCPDFVYRRDGLDPAGCKHVRALVSLGLLETGAGGRPARVVDPGARGN